MTLVLNPLEVAMIAVQGFGAMQKVAELAGLLDLVDSGKPRTILEIGFGKGGTAWAWTKMESVEQLICIDLPSGPWGGIAAESHAEVLDHLASNSRAKIDFISGHSQGSETLEAVEARLNGALVDVLFIDGDHSRVGAMADYDLYGKFVRPGGLIAFHDIAEHPPETGCEVKAFWDVLKATLPSDRFCEFIAEDDAPWAGIGVLKTEGLETQVDGVPRVDGDGGQDVAA